MEDNFCLSEKIKKIDEVMEEINNRRLGFSMYSKLDKVKEDVKEFIKIIEDKVLTDWKGQNEFIDWLKKRAGGKLK